MVNNFIDTCIDTCILLPAFQDGFTSLFIASQYNHLQVIDVLLGAGTKVDVANNVSAAKL